MYHSSLQKCKQLWNCLLLIDALSHLIQIFVIMQVLFLLCNRMHWLYNNFLIYNVTVTIINGHVCSISFYFHTSTSACWNSIIDFYKQNLEVCCSLELYMIHHLNRHAKFFYKEANDIHIKIIINECWQLTNRLNVISAWSP